MVVWRASSTSAGRGPPDVTAENATDGSTPHQQRIVFSARQLGGDLRQRLRSAAVTTLLAACFLLLLLLLLLANDGGAGSSARPTASANQRGHGSNDTADHGPTAAAAACLDATGWYQLGRISTRHASIEALIATALQPLLHRTRWAAAVARRQAGRADAETTTRFELAVVDVGTNDGVDLFLWHTLFLDGHACSAPSPISRHNASNRSSEQWDAASFVPSCRLIAIEPQPVYGDAIKTRLEVLRRKEERRSLPIAQQQHPEEGATPGRCGRGLVDFEFWPVAVGTERHSSNATTAHRPRIIGRGEQAMVVAGPPSAELLDRLRRARAHDRRRQQRQNDALRAAGADEVAAPPKSGNDFWISTADAAEDGETGSRPHGPDMETLSHILRHPRAPPVNSGMVSADGCRAQSSGNETTGAATPPLVPFMKIDIEGADAAVIHDIFALWLRPQRVGILVFEANRFHTLHSSGPNGVFDPTRAIELLHSAGYVVCLVGKPPPRSDEPAASTGDTVVLFTVVADAAVVRALDLSRDPRVLVALHPMLAGADLHDEANLAPPIVTTRSPSPVSSTTLGTWRGPRIRDCGMITGAVRVDAQAARGGRASSPSASTMLDSIVKGGA